jgi:hypothetical protein
MTAASATLACVALRPSAAAYQLVGAGLVLAGIAGISTRRGSGSILPDSRTGIHDSWRCQRAEACWDQVRRLF